MKKELVEFLPPVTYQSQVVKLVKLLALAEKHDRLLEAAEFLSSVGSPVKSSKDFERAFKKAFGELQEAVKAIRVDTEELKEPITEEEKAQIMEIAKEYGIRPTWLEVKWL